MSEPISLSQDAVAAPQSPRHPLDSRLNQTPSWPLRVRLWEQQTPRTAETCTGSEPQEIHPPQQWPKTINPAPESMTTTISSTSWGFAGPTHKIDEGDVNIDFLVIKAQLPPTKGHRGCATGSRERNGVHRPHPMARVSPVRLSPPCQAFGLAHTHNSASPLPRCSMCQLQTASTRLLRSANRVRRALSLCNGLTFLASETSKARAETKNT